LGRQQKADDALSWSSSGLEQLLPSHQEAATGISLCLSWKPLTLFPSFPQNLPDEAKFEQQRENTNHFALDRCIMIIAASPLFSLGM